MAFRATKISTTLRADVPVAIRATKIKNLEDTMLPINYRSWKCSFSELPNSFQQWELTFLSTITFGATKILSFLLTVAIRTTLRVDVPVSIRATKNLEDTMLPINYRSWKRSFSELPKSCQHWELTFLLTAAFRATKILSAVGVNIPLDRSFQSYQNPDNFKSWRSCSFQSYQKSRRHYASRQLSELTT